VAKPGLALFGQQPNRSLSRTRAKSLSRSHARPGHKQDGSTTLEFLAARTLLGGQSITPTVNSTSTSHSRSYSNSHTTLDSRSRSNSYSFLHSRSHSHSHSHSHSLGNQSKWKVKELRLQLLRMQKVMNQNGTRNRAAVIFGPVLHGPVQSKWKQKGTCTRPALSTTLVEIHMDMVNLVLFMYTIIMH